MKLNMKLLPGVYSVIQVRDISKINFEKFKESFFNLCITEDEISVLLNQEYSDFIDEKINEEKGFKCLKIEGVLDFGEIGIIARISSLLAKEEISIFVVSTYNTDYVLVKENKIAHVLHVLKENQINISEISTQVLC
jgi:hypothetical protein